MTKTISIALPVSDLKKSMAFYEALGFTNNATFSGEAASFMVWSEAINVILLTHEAWKTRTSRPICPSSHSEVGMMLSMDSRDAVDAANAAAAAHGGTPDINPIEDEGSIYGRDFTDPDGHVWGATWMDPAAMATAQ
jgi:predicted lactoylglutathione lyase